MRSSGTGSPQRPHDGDVSRPSLGRSLSGVAVHSVFQHRSLGERLYDAAFEGDFDRLKLLMEKAKPEDINWKNAHGSSVLFVACQQGHTSCVRLLAQQKCIDLDSSRDEGASPLYIACQNGHKDVAQILIDKGADKNRTTLSGATALYIAAQCGHDTVVRLLMDKGVDRNKPNHDGYTPLFIAAALCHVAVVKRLLENGADMNKARNDGATPLFMAAFSGHSQVVEMLLKHGADRNTPTTEGCSPLFVAAQQGHVEVVRLLLDHGCDLSRSNFNGHTPLQIAVAGGHSAIVRLLKAREGVTSLNAPPQEEAAVLAASGTPVIGRKGSAPPQNKLNSSSTSSNGASTGTSTPIDISTEKTRLRSSGDPNGSAEKSNSASGSGIESRSLPVSSSSSMRASSGNFAATSSVSEKGEKGVTEVPRCKIIVGSQLEFDKVICVQGSEKDPNVLYIMDYLITRVAVRRLHKSYEEGYFARKELIREANIFHDLKHPKIMEFVGLCQTPPCLVYEYLEKGDLFSLISRDSACHWTNYGRKMLADIADGLSFLHSADPQQTHGSLTSESVYVSRDYVAKIANFRVHRLKPAPPQASASMPALYKQDELLQKHLLSSKEMIWVAPELLVEPTSPSSVAETPTQIARQSDMYSFGIIVWEVLEQKEPWKGRTDYDRIAELVRKGKAFDRLVLSEASKKVCPENVVQLLKRCLALDMSLRPSAAEFSGALHGIVCPRAETDKEKAQNEKEKKERRKSVQMGLEVSKDVSPSPRKDSTSSPRNSGAFARDSSPRKEATPKSSGGGFFSRLSFTKSSSVNSSPLRGTKDAK